MLLEKIMEAEELSAGWQEHAQPIDPSLLKEQDWELESGVFDYSCLFSGKVNLIVIIIEGDTQKAFQILDEALPQCVPEDKRDKLALLKDKVAKGGPVFHCS